MNKKKQVVNKKHRKTKTRLKKLKDISLQSKKKKITNAPKKVEAKETAKKTTTKKTTTKKTTAKKTTAKKTTTKK